MSAMQRATTRPIVAEGISRAGRCCIDRCVFGAFVWTGDGVRRRKGDSGRKDILAGLAMVSLRPIGSLPFLVRLRHVVAVDLHESIGREQLRRNLFAGAIERHQSNAREWRQTHGHIEEAFVLFAGKVLVKKSSSLDCVNVKADDRSDVAFGQYGFGKHVCRCDSGQRGKEAHCVKLSHVGSMVHTTPSHLAKLFAVRRQGGSCIHRRMIVWHRPEPCAGALRLPRSFRWFADGWRCCFRHGKDRSAWQGSFMIRLKPAPSMLNGAAEVSATVPQAP